MPPEVPPGRKLNPFALPVESGGCYMLFVVSCTLVMFNITLCLRHGPLTPAHSPFRREYSVQPSPEARIRRAGVTAEDFPEFLHSLARAGKDLGVSLVWVAGVLGLARFFYWNHQGIECVDDVVPHGTEKNSPLQSEIAALATIAGVAPAPTVEVGHTPYSQEARVFGLPGWYVLRLGGGMKTLFEKDISAFRSVVFHELAHIFHGDLKKNYFTKYLYTLVMVFGVLPFLCMALYLLVEDQVRHPSLAHLLRWSGPVFFVLLLQCVAVNGIGQMRRELLRAQEFYADQRAEAWGQPGALASFIGAQIRRTYSPASTTKGPTLSSRPTLFERMLISDDKGAWRRHPPIMDRYAALEDPSRLSRTLCNQAFWLGGATSWVIRGLVVVLCPVAAILNAGSRTLFSGRGWEGERLERYLILVLCDLVPCGFAAIFATKALGPHLQRQAVVQSPAKTSRHRGFGVANGVSLFVLGFEFGFVTWAGDFSLMDYRRVLQVDLPLAAALAVLLFVWGVFTMHFVQSWLGSCTGPAPPSNRRYQGLNLLSASVLGVLLFAVVITRGRLYSMVGNAHVAAALRPAVTLIFAGFGLFVTAMLVTGVYHIASPVVCKACGAGRRGSYALGRSCDRCGADLTPWLFQQTPKPGYSPASQ